MLLQGSHGTSITGRLTLCCDWGSSDFSPALESLDHRFTVVASPEAVTTGAEVGGNRPIGGKEALCVARGLEPSHDPFPLPRGLVGVFRTVVQVSVLSVLDAREHVPLRSPIAFELIRDDDSWDVGLPLEELAEELLGRVLVPPALYKNIEDIALLVHRPPQIVAGASDREEHLVQVPLVAGFGASMPESIGIPLTELAAPFADGFVGHHDPTGEQQLFDIAVAQAETKVQPDTVSDNFRRKPVAFIRIGRRERIHVATMPHKRRAGQLGRLS